MITAIVALAALWVVALVVVGLAGGSSTVDVDRALRNDEQIFVTTSSTSGKQGMTHAA